jgi:hypothetical protein
MADSFFSPGGSSIFSLPNDEHDKSAKEEAARRRQQEPLGSGWLTTSVAETSGPGGLGNNAHRASDSDLVALGREAQVLATVSLIFDLAPSG